MQRVCRNAWGQYIRCRENASSESNKRAKILRPPNKIHPFFAPSLKNKNTSDTENFILQMKSYRPKGVRIKI